jgi:hypothetical protein
MLGEVGLLPCREGSSAASDILNGQEDNGVGGEKEDIGDW